VSCQVPLKCGSLCSPKAMNPSCASRVARR
jgi:hypothetical protein